jgi:ATP-dependent DNA helicase PIF1
MCVIDKTSQQANLFWECSLIIWDEIHMQHWHCPKVVDHSLHDICSNDKLFGSLVVVFGRDFHKKFLVIIKESKGQIVVAFLQRSLLWDGICILKLQQNIWLKHF